MSQETPPTGPLETPQEKDWDHFWKRDQSKQFSQISWSKRRIIQVLQPLSIEGKSALDAGCGSGFFSKYFCDQGMDCVSFDYSQGALDMASQITEGRSQLVKGDLIEQPLTELVQQRFDVIFTDGLFEHFSRDDQDRIMKNLISVLSPSGSIVTFVPNRWSPWELIRPFYMPGIEEKPFVLKELVDLNTRNGLAVSRQGGVNTLPFSVSPEGAVASRFGMLLYTIAQLTG